MSAARAGYAGARTVGVDCDRSDTTPRMAIPDSSKPKPRMESAKAVNVCFPGYRIHNITNGVHFGTWTHPAFAGLYTESAQAT